MEVGCFSSDFVADEKMLLGSVVETVVIESFLAAQRSLACLFMVAGSLLMDVDRLPKLPGTDQRFPFNDLHRMEKPDPECKDGSDTEDEDEDDDDAEEPDDDDAGDEDFSGEEGGEDDEDDPEADPEANGNEGSDDDDDDDDNDDDDEDGDEDEEEEEDEDEEEQPPAKKRK